MSYLDRDFHSSPREPDCESAALLRARVIPIFESAKNWTALIADLRQKGFGLIFYDGRLALADPETGMTICTGRFVGYSLSELVARMGRPHVHPVGGTANAVVVH